MIDHSLESGLVPRIFFLVFVEEGGQSSLVFVGFFPNFLVADFVKKKTVVIFLNQVFQFLVLGGHLVHLLFNDSLGGCSLGLGHFVQFLINDALANVALLDEVQNVGAHRVVGEETALVNHFDDVVAVWREHGLAHFAFVQGESGLFKVGNELSLRHPRQFTAIHRRTFVVAQSAGEVGEVSTVFQCFCDGIDARLGGFLLCFGCLLTEHQQDVGRLHHSTHRVDAVGRFVVDAMGLGLNVCIGDEGRANLLVAIRHKFLAERGHRVHSSLFRGLDFQFVVDEQIDVFGHVFLVDDTVGIVLVERILKL